MNKVGSSINRQPAFGEFNTCNHESKYEHKYTQTTQVVVRVAKTAVYNAAPFLLELHRNWWYGGFFSVHEPLNVVEFTCMNDDEDVYLVIDKVRACFGSRLTLFLN